MPQLNVYNYQTNPAGPVDIPRAAGEKLGIGRSLQQAGAAVQNTGEVVQEIKTGQELNEQTKDVSEMHLNFTKKAQEDLKNGVLNFDDFKTQYDEYASKLEEKYTTPGAQKNFQRSNQILRQHFLEQALQGQAQIAGNKAKTNIQESMDNYSSILLSDPSSLEPIKEQWKLENKEHLASLDYDARAKINDLAMKGFTRDALRGSIDQPTVIDPNTGKVLSGPLKVKEDIMAGRYDKELSGDLKNQMIGEAETGYRAEQAAAARLREEERRLLKESREQTESDFYDLFDSGRLTNKMIRESNLSGRQQFWWRDKLNNNKKQPKTSNPAVVNMLYERTHLPYGDPKRINSQDEYNAFFEELNWTDLKNLRAEFAEAGTVKGRVKAQMEKDLFAYARRELVKGGGLSGIQDPEGEAQLKLFREAYQTARQGLMDQGKDPNVLVRSDSPEYFGKYVKSNFKRGFKEITKSQAQAFKKPAPIPIPDYSVETDVMPKNAPPVKEFRPRGEKESLIDYLRAKKEAQGKK